MRQDQATAEKARGGLMIGCRLASPPGQLGVLVRRAAAADMPGRRGFLALCMRAAVGSGQWARRGSRAAMAPGVYPAGPDLSAVSWVSWGEPGELVSPLSPNE